MPMGIVSDSDFDEEVINTAIINGVPIQDTSDKSNVNVPCVDIRDNTDPITDPERRMSTMARVQGYTETISGVVEGKVVDIPHKGRSKGDVNVPESIRKLIGETAAIEGRSAAVDLAKGFGISPSSVSAYAVGATSTDKYHEPDDELKTYITGRKKKLSKKALNRLNLALHYITKEKLVDAKITDIVSVANSMSQVVKNLAPPEPRNPTVEVTNKPVFMLYRPEMKSEESFDIIHSRD